MIDELRNWAIIMTGGRATMLGATRAWLLASIRSVRTMCVVNRANDIYYRDELADFRPAQIIEQIYIRSLTRAPKPDEMKTLLELVAKNPDKKQALEDVFWAVMNSREFMFNH